MKRTILIRGQTVVYTLERKRVKNINLRVKRDGGIAVSAAPWVPLGVIERFLLSRGDFLLRALAGSERREAQPWAEGRELRYLGRPLRLTLAQGTRTRVELGDGVLRLTLRAPDDPERVRGAVERWYRAESERLCRTYCERLRPRFAPRGVPEPEIRMRAMRSAWGNCRPARGVVTFNSMLAAAEPACIEYVVAHELTHFLHADHSPAFYAALARVIPDWKERRARLKALAAVLFS